MRARPNHIICLVRIIFYTRSDNHPANCIARQRPQWQDDEANECRARASHPPFRGHPGKRGHRCRHCRRSQCARESIFHNIMICEHKFFRLVESTGLVTPSRSLRSGSLPLWRIDYCTVRDVDCSSIHIAKRAIVPIRPLSIVFRFALVCVCVRRAYIRPRLPPLPLSSPPPTYAARADSGIMFYLVSCTLCAVFTLLLSHRFGNSNSHVKTHYVDSFAILFVRFRFFGCHPVYGRGGGGGGEYRRLSTLSAFDRLLAWAACSC